MGLKIERVEDRQLPRWVYALIAAKANPDDPEAFDDNPKMRGANQLKAEAFHKDRMDRLKALAEQSNWLTSSRIDGREWTRRPRTTFTSEELDKILPGRRLSYVVMKTALISVIAFAVIIAMLATASIIAAVCAEVKLGGSPGEAIKMFVSDPGAYIQRVYDALSTDNFN